MIPRSEIEIWQSDEPHAGWMPSSRRIRDRFLDGNRDFSDEIADADWNDATDALETESALIAEAEQAESHAEFEEILDNESGEWDLYPDRNRGYLAAW